jgi:hypothetical protein
MKIDRDDNRVTGSTCIRIEPFDDDFTRITVYQYVDIKDGAYEEPKINWSALGGQSREVAKGYAEGILKAVELASELSARTGQPGKLFTQGTK